MPVLGAEGLVLWHCISQMTYPWRDEAKISPRNEPFFSFFVALQAVGMQIGGVQGTRLYTGSLVGK